MHELETTLARGQSGGCRAGGGARRQSGRLPGTDAEIAGRRRPFGRLRTGIVQQSSEAKWKNRVSLHFLHFVGFGELGIGEVKAHPGWCRKAAFEPPSTRERLRRGFGACTA